jgi:hypothetical protein
MRCTTSLHFALSATEKGTEYRLDGLVLGLCHVKRKSSDMNPTQTPPVAFYVFQGLVLCFGNKAEAEDKGK